VDVSAPLKEKAHALQKFWEFAETLLNLQDVEGFEVPLDELSYGKIEDTCGELDLARLIHLHAWAGILPYLAPDQLSALSNFESSARS
jgi:hypothetical protein